MKVRTPVLLAAAALIIPMAASLLTPDFAQARSPRHGNRAELIAQGGGRILTPEQREAKMAEREAKMKAELGLSDQQAAQIQAIRESYKPQFEALRAQGKALKDSGADRTAMEPIREQMKTLRGQVKAEIGQVLTPEQRAKAEAMKPERGDRRGGRGERGTAPAQ